MLEVAKDYTKREERLGSVSGSERRVFNWELIFWISSLILVFMAIGALATYQSFVHAR